MVGIEARRFDALPILPALHRMLQKLGHGAFVAPLAHEDALLIALNKELAALLDDLPLEGGKHPQGHGHHLEAVVQIEVGPQVEISHP